MPASIKTRYLYPAILGDAFPKHKLIFISGPRQDGNTTLAKSFIPPADNYFTHEDETFRRAWSQDPLTAIASRAAGP